jgi:hypothetical protein
MQDLDAMPVKWLPCDSMSRVCFFMVEETSTVHAATASLLLHLPIRIGCEDSDESMDKYKLSGSGLLWSALGHANPNRASCHQNSSEHDSSCFNTLSCPWSSVAAISKQVAQSWLTFCSVVRHCDGTEALCRPFEDSEKPETPL